MRNRLDLQRRTSQAGLRKSNRIIRIPINLEIEIFRNFRQISKFKLKSRGTAGTHFRPIFFIEEKLVHWFVIHISWLVSMRYVMLDVNGRQRHNDLLTDLVLVNHERSVNEVFQLSLITEAAVSSVPERSYFEKFLKLSTKTH